VLLVLRTEEHVAALTPPMEAVEGFFRQGCASIIQAAFAHSFFLRPEAVRERTPWLPNAARSSRRHYPNLSKGDGSVWEGRDVKLDDNSKAQLAWSKYSGRPIARRCGYGVRHIWGHPWHPLALIGCSVPTRDGGASSSATGVLHGSAGSKTIGRGSSTRYSRRSVLMTKSFALQATRRGKWLGACASTTIRRIRRLQRSPVRKL
jgi:hypothetical protein